MGVAHKTICKEESFLFCVTKEVTLKQTYFGRTGGTLVKSQTDRKDIIKS